MATLRLGDIAPDFEAETTLGKIHFHEWLGDSWEFYFLILRISHLFVQQSWEPLNYPEFVKRNTKVIAQALMDWSLT
jgi:alkyl hydroperoxide reductase subunit AhpC